MGSGRWRWTRGRMSRWPPGIAVSCRRENTKVQGTGNRDQGTGWLRFVVSHICRTGRADMEHPVPGQSLAVRSLKFRGTPPPILWTQNPCFLRVTRRVALQNIENNEVPCTIFQAKELRDVSASAGHFR